MRPSLYPALVFAFIAGAITAFLWAGRYEWEQSGQGMMVWRHDRLTGRSRVSIAGSPWRVVVDEQDEAQRRAEQQARSDGERIETQRRAVEQARAERERIDAERRASVSR